MTAHYLPIAKAPKSAPDAHAVVRVVSDGGFYRHYYVDGRADAKALCRDLGLGLMP